MNIQSDNILYLNNKKYPVVLYKINNLPIEKYCSLANNFYFFYMNSP